MKKTTKTVLGILLMSSIAFVSCKKEDIVEEPANNSSTTDQRDKFIGSYLMKDTGAYAPGPFTSIYTITITKGNLGGDTVSVHNFAETGVSNLGVVTGNSLFVFQNPAHLISGSAILNGTYLKFSYTPFEGNRRGTGTKQ